MSARKDERAGVMYELYQAGASCSEIAAQFGITRQTVQQTFHDRGWKLRDRLSAANVANVKHGLKSSQAYTAWQNAKQRTSNPEHPSWADYGGRNIVMCSEWINDFARFHHDMGDPPPGLTLDRIDVNGPYSAANCRWVDRSVQARNKRVNLLITHDGRTQTLADWADELEMNYWTLHARVRRGWSVERILRRAG